MPSADARRELALALGASPQRVGLARGSRHGRAAPRAGRSISPAFVADLFVEGVVPDLATAGGRGALGLGEAGVAAAVLEVVDAPGDHVVQQLQHAGDVVLVDVRDVDEVELLAGRARARPSAGATCSR